MASKKKKAARKPHRSREQSKSPADAASPKAVPQVDFPVEHDEDAFQEDGLTIRQRLFVAAIIGPAGGNATKAARMAGYRDDNENALRVTASENLTKPNVQRAIAHALANRIKNDPEWAKASLFELASASMSNFLKFDGQRNVTIDWEKAAAAGALGQIKEITQDTVGEITVRTKIKLFDRLKAIELALKLHGLIRDAGAADPGDGPSAAELARQMDAVTAPSEAA